ncbi:MAG: TetR/AcrR family transcriptional regulator [Beijerinckiaceae bacterium]|nr:TetR/AcrR family transcriptional regulator [Beijerinckiaceae bacterium]
MTDTFPADQPSLQKRRQRRKEARPAELIEAGLHEFAARGFAGARLVDVAARAGVSKGTIYRYFADKEALFLAAIETQARPLLDEVSGFVDAFPGTTRELLGLLFGIAHRRLVDSQLRTLIRIIIAEGDNFPVLTEIYYRETVSKARVIFDGIVQRGIERNEVKPGAVAELPIILMAPAIMAVIWQLTFQKHEPIDPDAFLKAHVSLVCDGFLID